MTRVFNAGILTVTDHICVIICKFDPNLHIQMLNFDQISFLIAQCYSYSKYKDLFEQFSFFMTKAKTNFLA